LTRNISFDVIFQKESVQFKEHCLSSNEISQLFIRVENYEEGTVYYWNTSTFYNRYDIMKDLFQKYEDDEVDIEVIKFL
jgi:hypothetical protein